MKNIGKIYRYAQAFSDAAGLAELEGMLWGGAQPKTAPEASQQPAAQPTAQPTAQQSATPWLAQQPAKQPVNKPDDPRLQIGKREAYLMRGLDTRFQPVVKEFLERCYAAGLPVAITDGFRSCAVQQKLYDQGRKNDKPKVTNAPPGSSLHNYGLAIDVARKKDKGFGFNYRWKEGEYDKVVAIAKSLGLRWGGDWKNFKDKPHFEFVSQQDIALGKFKPQKQCKV